MVPPWHRTRENGIQLHVCSLDPPSSLHTSHTMLWEEAEYHLPLKGGSGQAYGPPSACWTAVVLLPNWDEARQ